MKNAMRGIKKTTKKPRSPKIHIHFNYVPSTPVDRCLGRAVRSGSRRVSQQSLDFIYDVSDALCSFQR
jgi:hypothetical protein